MVGRLILHYRIEEEIASGGMGVVYLGTDTNLDRPVAIKFLPEELTRDAGARSRFIHEAKAASRLNHPNILTIHAEEAVDGQHFIVMEYVKGQSLSDLIAASSRLTPLRAIEIATQIAGGLQAAHEAGIVHQDISAANILVSNDGWVKIVDFGLAVLRGSSLNRDKSRFAGTMLYASPEQILAQGVDHRTDIWSFGILLHEMLCGQRPFDDGNSAALAYSIVNEPHGNLLRRAPDVPGGVVDIVDECLAKEAGSRIQSMREVVERLRLELHQLQHDEIVRRQSARTAAHSVAVLPLCDTSPDGEYDYFCRGITEAITNELSRSDDIRVIPRSESLACASRCDNPFAAGQTLGVETVLDGRVSRRGEQIRIDVAFHAVREGSTLWTETYDRPASDIFEIQSRIAESVTRSLHLLSEMRRKPVAARGVTSSPEAYDFYLRARDFFHHGRRKSLMYARELFGRAAQTDPHYLLAHVGLANCCSLLVHFYGSTDEATRQLAGEASRRAVELDPASGDAHAARGFALWVVGRHGEADWEFDTAIRLNPQLSEAYYLYGRSCFQRGKLEDAVRLFESAARLESNHEYLYFLAQTLTALKRENEAGPVYRRAIEALDRRMILSPDDANAATMAAVAHCRLGESEAGLRWADRARSIDAEDPRIMYNVACLYALEGEAEKAIECLELAVQAGFGQREWVEKDPDLDSIRDHPRFQSLIWRQS